MNRISRVLANSSQMFAVVIGLTDGILTALTLAAGHLTGETKPTLELSLRIALGSAICGIFVFYAAEYARLRGELIRAEKQLNLSTRGHFVTTQLGKQVRSEAVGAALLSSSANFIGALFPLFLGALMPSPPELAVAPSIVALAALGWLLARMVHGKAGLWAGALVAAGIAVFLAGRWLHIA
jgi:VIT1/CCC1 family predicted Fe2+/Mn2+ transporter